MAVEAGIIEEGPDQTFKVVEEGQMVPDGNEMVRITIDMVLAAAMIMEETDLTMTGEVMEDTDLTMTGMVEMEEEETSITTTEIDKVTAPVGVAIEAEITSDPEVDAVAVGTRFRQEVAVVIIFRHRGMEVAAGIKFHREPAVETVFRREVEETTGHLVVVGVEEDEEGHVALADPVVEVVMAPGVTAVITALRVEVVTSVREVEASVLMPALLGPLAGVYLVEAQMGGVVAGRDPKALAKVLA